MKIATICQTYPPMISGVSLTLKRLATGMARRGHAVLAQAMGRACRRIAETHSVEQSLELHEAYYQEICARFSLTPITEKVFIGIAGDGNQTQEAV